MGGHAASGTLGHAMAEIILRLQGDRKIYAKLRAEFDKTLLAAALAENENHRGRAAEKLGLGRNTVTRKLGSSRRKREGTKNG